ncbi:MAG: DUF2905 domain-containing protein [Sphingomonadaceae bacterium]
MADLGKLLLVIGGLVFLLGLIMLLAGNVPFLGRLPGDISFQWGNVRVYFPLATMILLSIILTVLLNLVLGVFRR